jgi:hypothetical protein
MSIASRNEVAFAGSGGQHAQSDRFGQSWVIPPLPRGHGSPVGIRHGSLPVATDQLDPAAGQQCRDLAKYLPHSHSHSPVRQLASELPIIGRSDTCQPDQR